MVEHRFNVFDTPVAVRTCDGVWCAFYLGTDGTSRRADFIVPADIPADDLAIYLANLFHEYATARCPHVLPLF